MKNTNTKYGIFYKSQGRWTPVRTTVTRQPKTFTSETELNRFVNSSYFNYVRNNILKSRIAIRQIK